MTLWLIIMTVTLIITGLSLLYLGNRVSKFALIKNSNIKAWQKNLRGILLVILLFVVTAKLWNFVNAVVCVFYFALIWLACDWLFMLAAKFCRCIFKRYYAGGSAIILSVLALASGWYLNHDVWQTDYWIYSDKLDKPLKIAMFADAHVGTTFNADGLAKHLGNIQKQKPDLLIIAGDFVDDETKKEEMIAACKLLGELETKYGTYFVFGNHDEGYYGREYRGYSGADLIKELEKNGIVVLRDEAKSVNGRFYVLGRKDASTEREHRGGRIKISELVKDLDKSKYIIVVDHQPNDYENEEKAEVDLVLSGHTHGGQLFPLNYVGKWIGANDKIYGHEKRGKTDFIVTSGISDWAIKFKTGTKSEFVIVNIEPR